MNNNPTGKNQYAGRGGAASRLINRLATNSNAQSRKGGSNFVVAATKRVRGYSPAMLKRIASLHASMLKGNR